MPGATARYGWHYGVLSDTPDGATQEQTLAQDVEVTVGGLDDRTVNSPKGYIGSHKPVAAVSSAGTTETVACVVQWTAVTGRRYMCRWQGDMSGTGTTTTANLRIRFKQTASTTDITGTIISARDSPVNAGANTPCDQFGDFVAASSLTYTVVATIQANGTGNAVQAYNATTHTPNLTIEDIGV